MVVQGEPRKVRRIPAFVVTEEMFGQLDELKRGSRLSMGETLRQVIGLFFVYNATITTTDTDVTDQEQNQS